MSSENMFLVRCDLAADAADQLAPLRGAHREYLGGLADRIVLGGLTGERASAPTSVTYLLHAVDLRAASEVPEGDPYRPLYAEIAVERFHPRLPPEQGS